MKRLSTLFGIIATASLLAGCGEPDADDGVVNPPLYKEQTTAPMASPPPAEVQEVALVRLAPASGSDVEGEATFTQVGDKVRMALELEGLAPGQHAVHIHARGDCAAPDASSAGGHWNPGEKPHGRWGEPPHHLGDIGNVRADAQGMARLSMTTDRWALDDGADGVDGNDGLNGVSGKAVVVHAGTDDYESQPSGAAGARIGCGVIERTR